MVNLVRGRSIFYHKVGKEASLIKFDLSGDKFFMVTEEKIGVRQAEDAKLLCELEGNKKILCAAPGECIVDAHSARVKGVVVLTKNDGGGDADDPYLVALAYSDGVICVWDVCIAVKEKPISLAQAKTNLKLTCLAGSSIKYFLCLFLSLFFYVPICQFNDIAFVILSALQLSCQQLNDLPKKFTYSIIEQHALARGGSVQPGADGESVGSPIVKVTDPEEAYLFFVPVFSSLNLIINNGGGPAPEGGACQCSDNEMQEELVEWLEKQEYWRRNNRLDHVIVAGDLNAMLRVVDR
ncbi:hypothetical protein Patl1_12367 [Pistacia atlantica]|uniref:Uncharacterized protein n=1 Tax=Pistacia atlantica TaxID=434234 RepID=A0ACC1A3A5_9ROSI|nr:hypothetical protein Patl1_12367 [Pistacia atlantica]